MGFGYTNDAGRVLDAIDREVAAQAADRSGNVYRDAKGNRYFYEVSRRDQPDGGICGTIHKFVGENMARKTGRFKITGDGRLMDAPAHFYALLEADAAKRIARRAPAAGAR